MSSLKTRFNMSITHFILLSLMINVIVCMLNIHKSAENKLSLILKTIVYSEISSLKCISIITKDHIDKDIFMNIYSERTIMLFPIDEIEDEACNIQSLNTFVETAVNESCEGYIIQMSNPICFVSTWQQTAKMFMNRQHPQFFILPTAINSIDNLEHIETNYDQNCFDFKIIESFINNNSIKFASNKRIKQEINSQQKKITRCAHEKCITTSDHFYQEKKCKFEDIEIKVATFDYRPYAILNSSEMDGTEIRIAIEYARSYNYSLKIITDNAQWGNIYKNGTADGILGNVALKKADLGLGALYLWYNEYKYLDYSLPYIRSGVTCLVPKPKLLSAMLLFIRPFHVITWLTLLCVLLLSCIALYQVKKIESSMFESDTNNKFQQHRQWFTTKGDTVLRTFGFLVIQAYNSRVIDSPAIRHLVNCLHLMCLIVVTCYNSGLASILTVPSYQPPINSAQDLIDSQLNWGATHDAWIFSLREAKDPKTLTLVKRFKALTEEQLKRYSFTGDFSFSVERLPAGHFAVGEYINENSMKNLRLMKEDIYYEYVITAFPKGSPYLESYNNLILRLFSSGIILFWEGEVARKYLNISLQSAIKESSSVITRAHPTIIQPRHLQGAFLILLVGLSLALLVFCIEIILYKHK